MTIVKIVWSLDYWQELKFIFVDRKDIARVLIYSIFYQIVKFLCHKDKILLVFLEKLQRPCQTPDYQANSRNVSFVTHLFIILALRIRAVRSKLRLKISLFYCLLSTAYTWLLHKYRCTGMWSWMARNWMKIANSINLACIALSATNWYRKVKWTT